MRDDQQRLAVPRRFPGPPHPPRTAARGPTGSAKFADDLDCARWTVQRHLTAFEDRGRTLEPATDPQAPSAPAGTRTTST